MLTALLGVVFALSKRSSMMALGKTYEAEMKREHMIKNDPSNTLVGNIIAQFYKGQETKRNTARMQSLRTPPRRR
jgi:hypothetical protein